MVVVVEEHILKNHLEEVVDQEVVGLVEDEDQNLLREEEEV